MAEQKVKLIQNKFRSPNPYFQFMNDFRIQQGSQYRLVVDLAKKCGAIWRNMTMEEKAPYIEAALVFKKSNTTRKPRKQYSVKKRKSAR